MKNYILFYLLSIPFIGFNQQRNDTIIAQGYIQMIHELLSHHLNPSQVDISLNDYFIDYSVSGPMGVRNYGDSLMYSETVRNIVSKHFADTIPMIYYLSEPSFMYLNGLSNSLKRFRRVKDYTFFYIDRPIDDQNYYDFRFLNDYPASYTFSASCLEFGDFDVPKITTLIFDVSFESKDKIVIHQLK